MPQHKNAIIRFAARSIDYKRSVELTLDRRPGIQQLSPSACPQEVRVSGDIAYSWNKLNVTITPLSGGPAKHRSGYTLGILRGTAEGSWVVARDANLLGEAK